MVVGCTLAFEAFFAKRANGLAYRRVCDRMSVEEYVRRERVWAIASVPAAAALIGWALWFHLVFEVGALAASGPVRSDSRSSEASFRSCALTA